MLHALRCASCAKHSSMNNCNIIHLATNVSHTYANNLRKAITETSKSHKNSLTTKISEIYEFHTGARLFGKRFSIKNTAEASNPHSSGISVTSLQKTQHKKRSNLYENPRIHHMWILPVFFLPFPCLFSANLQRYVRPPFRRRKKKANSLDFFFAFPPMRVHDSLRGRC